MEVEEWLTNMEPLNPTPTTTTSDSNSTSNDVNLQLHSSENRNWPVTLLSISPSCLKDVLPHLNVGDALDLVWKPLPEEGEEEETRNAARDELVGVLGGREVVMNLKGDAEDGKGGYKPWALRYGGRQFGSWAGQVGLSVHIFRNEGERSFGGLIFVWFCSSSVQLGDGRAVSLRSSPLSLAYYLPACFSG